MGKHIIHRYLFAMINDICHHFLEWILRLISATHLNPILDPPPWCHLCDQHFLIRAFVKGLHLKPSEYTPLLPIYHQNFCFQKKSLILSPKTNWTKNCQPGRKTAKLERIAVLFPYFTDLGVGLYHNDWHHACESQSFCIHEDDRFWHYSVPMSTSGSAQVSLLVLPSTGGTQQPSVFWSTLILCRRTSWNTSACRDPHRLWRWLSVAGLLGY